MARPFALLTGFGPFLDIEENPSGLLAEAIGRDAPPGLDIKAAVLPVAYKGVGAKLRELLDEEERQPALILGMGVHAGSSFRLESRASAVLSSSKLDNDGVLGSAVSPLSAGERATRVDMEMAAELLTGVARTEVEISTDAGGYVCECTYHAILSEALRIDSRGLFLHVPSLDVIPLTEQIEVVRSFLAQLVPALRYGCAAIDPS